MLKAQELLVRRTEVQYRYKADSCNQDSWIFHLGSILGYQWIFNLQIRYEIAIIVLPLVWDSS